MSDSYPCLLYTNASCGQIYSPQSITSNCRSALRAGTTFPSRSLYLNPHIPSHLQTPSHLPVSISHLVDLVYPIRRHLEFRAVRICHLVHLVHLIYAIWAHVDLGRASRPSHLPSCHLKMEIEIWVFTSFPSHASPQVCHSIELFQLRLCHLSCCKPAE